MEIRLFVISLIIFIGIFFVNNAKGSVNNFAYRKLYVQIICVILILQSGLRHVAVGPDTYAYFMEFERVGGFSWAEIWERILAFYRLGIGKDPGYYVFQKVAYSVFPNYQVFLVLIAVIFFVALGNFLLKNTHRFSDLIYAFTFYSVMFYSIFSITAHRQTIATAAALVGFELIKKRRLLPFLLLILLASTIHISVLIFLPLYFLYNIKNVKFFYGAILALFPVLFALRYPISNFIKVASGFEEYGIYEGAGTFNFTALLIIIGLVGLWRYKNTLRVNTDKKGLFMIIALAIFFTPLTWVNPSAMRAVLYFSVFLMVFIPSVISSFSIDFAHQRRLIYAITLAALIGIFINSNHNAGHIAEYKFFWQEMQLGPNY